MEPQQVQQSSIEMDDVKFAADRWVEAAVGWLVLVDASGKPRVLLNATDEHYVTQAARTYYPRAAFKIARTATGAILMRRA